MKRFLVAVVLTWLVAGSAWGAAQRSGTVTLDVDLSAQPKGQAARLWIPYPVSDAHQLISEVRINGDYSENGVYADRVNGTTMLYAEWPKDAVSRKLTFSFRVERQAIAQRDLPATEPAWNPGDYTRYLQPTSLGPITGEVKTLSDRITRGKSTNLEKARAIYDWTVENMFRDPDTKGCGKGDVCRLLTTRGGKCTDISSVFIALCRAAGVPAREVFGIRLGKKPVEDITTYQHCWSEFFVPGYGWVTADPADVRKAMLVEKLSLDNPKTREYRAFFWGGIDPYRVVLAKGRDVRLEPPQAEEPLNTFGYPYAEIGGKELDFYNPKGFTYRYTFKE